jgi:hypothetical protein
MERVENAVAQMPKESEADEKLFHALGVEPLTEVDRRKLSAEMARQKGELILPRLAEVLRRMAQERNGMEATEPIAAFIPWMDDRLKASGQNRVFIPTDDLLKAKNEADNDIWDFERGSSKALSSYLGKLGLKPTKNSQKQKRGYWIEQKWLEGQKGAYGTPIDPSDPSHVSETQ